MCIRDRRYHGSYLSAAYMFRIVSILVQLLLPFIISFNIEPFWLKRELAWTQPDVSFKYQMILMLESNTSSSGMVWSTYDQLNTMLQTKYRASDIQSREEDVNFDGKADNIYISARMPLASTESIYNVRMMAFFDYKIDDKVKLQMESAAYLDYSSAAPGSECHVHADLSLRQRSALDASSTWNTVYNYSLLNSTTIYSVGQARFSSLMNEYRKRNTTTELTSSEVVWVAGRPDEFNLYVTLRVPYEQSVLYVPGAVETLRYALVQYLVIYLLVASMISAFTRYLFAYHVFETCLLYTSDAADDLLCVDLGGRRIIKKKNNVHTH
eukprot:TRINITY_DN23034_c0_g1_i1.p1 TRINITY_DN23034_c0_g1~~TRINITY_DN23034_c0_g1_i1.p1  ORF type:complete len:325 (+),score=71.95 TRINITY_DN23034_c0_g1_i1:158-1132(+)